MDSATIYDLGIARYMPDGSLDTSFGEGGLLSVDYHGAGDLGQDVVVQGDGRVIVGGYAGNGSKTDFALVRINP